MMSTFLFNQDLYTDYASRLHATEETHLFDSAVALMGGGEDSAATLFHFLTRHAEGNTGMHIQPVYFDYGQQTSKIEIHCVKRQIEALRKRDYINIQELKVIKDPLADVLQDSGHYMVTGQNADKPLAHCVELRNLRFLVMASSLAMALKYEAVTIGAVPASVIDSGYSALIAAQIAVSANTQDQTSKVSIYAPFGRTHKVAGLLFMQEHNVSPDFLMYQFSCYTPIVDLEQKGILRQYTPCHACSSCQARAHTHRLAGIPDIFG